MKNLPTLSRMILPALLTQARGVSVPPGGIALSRTYQDVKMNDKSLLRYRTLLNWRHEAPFPFLYVLAQRAQTAMMLERAFTVAIPGLVHLRNELNQLASCNFREPFQLKTTGSIPYKAEGSLVITFTVDFWQADRKVAVCTSTYLAKRKSKSSRPRDKAPEVALIATPTHTENWDVPKYLGKQYAKASGDINPIHTIPLIARAMGFPRCILHGWYAASRATQAIEAFASSRCTRIAVDFKSPVYLPSRQVLRFSEDGQQTQFQLIDADTDKLTVAGELSSAID